MSKIDNPRNISISILLVYYLEAWKELCREVPRRVGTYGNDVFEHRSFAMMERFLSRNINEN